MIFLWHIPPKTLFYLVYSAINVHYHHCWSSPPFSTIQIDCLFCHIHLLPGSVILISATWSSSAFLRCCSLLHILLSCFEFSMPFKLPLSPYHLTSPLYCPQSQLPHVSNCFLYTILCISIFFIDFCFTHNSHFYLHLLFPEIADACCHHPASWFLFATLISSIFSLTLSIISVWLIIPFHWLLPTTPLHPSSDMLWSTIWCQQTTYTLYCNDSPTCNS